MANLRFIAANIVNAVTNGKSLSACLEPALTTINDARDRALVQAICYGVCRYYPRLDFILSCLLKKPMNAKDSDVHALLLVGLYQLMDMRIPPHAVVAETVAAVTKLKKPWAKGLLNAVLREYLRAKTDIDAKIHADPEALFAHDAWWLDAIKRAWPEQWEMILNANNDHPPFSLRVNCRHLSRAAYIQQYQLDAEIIPETSSGIMLNTPIAVTALPGFLHGESSVQDGAAQLAAELLQLAPGQRVLDACAAPGGKLTHILEIEPQLQACVAIDKEPERVQAIKQNLARLQLEAQCITHDVLDVAAWWDQQPFDRILLDAPCSASGVIRRHPDIKLLRQPTDIKALAKTQWHMLTALWPLLAPGGRLVYATCSIFPDENDAILQAFLATHPDAREEKITAAWGLPRAIGRQILPGMHGMDGFYYGVLVKS